MFRFQWAKALSIFAKNNYGNTMNNISEMLTPVLTEIGCGEAFAVKELH